MLSILSLVFGGIGRAIAGLAGFLSKPPGIYIAAAGTIALAIWWSGQRGYSHGQADCEATHKAAAQKEIVRQVIVYRDVAARSDQRTSNDAKTNADNQTKVVYVKIKAAAAPNAGALCVPPDVADSVRALR
jgi:hypothetical protein